MIKVENISVARGKRETLRDVTMQLSPGSVVGIVGPNGAGKSTLLDVLSGALPIIEGAVYLHGQPLRQFSLREQARVRAVMSQQVSMAFSFPVREVISMGWEPFRDTEVLSEARLAAVAEACGVTSLLDRQFETLSGGERQRVQYARTHLQVDGIAAFSDQGFWLLDEPTASLDIGHELSVLRNLRVTAARGIGVCVVLHDLEKAARFCDEIVLINDGSIEVIGAPRDVLTDQLLTSVYGTPIATEWHEGMRRMLVHA
ncbi:MAG: heme ABC transporter ATP-binding protein [Pseudomonadota bacterium]